jgi:hypothetical protein
MMARRGRGSSFFVSEKGGRLAREVLEEDVFEKTRSAVGKDDPDTLTSMESLTWTYRKLGREEEANAPEVEGGSKPSPRRHRKVTAAKYLLSQIPPLLRLLEKQISRVLH